MQTKLRRPTILMTYTNKTKCWVACTELKVREGGPPHHAKTSPTFSSPTFPRDARFITKNLRAESPNKNRFWRFYHNIALANTLNTTVMLRNFEAMEFEVV